MAILLDISQIIIANCAMAQYNPQVKKQLGSLDENLVKHMILNSIRMYNVKFKHEFGEMIICVDSKDTWRKKEFPPYKGCRQKSKDDGPLDWDLIYRGLNQMLADLREYFPYKVIKVESCEADDIIAVLASYLPEKTVIVSGDHDFEQLLRYKNVSLFSSTTKKFVEVDDPIAKLEENIIRGEDKLGDGIPNILSDDDCFIKGIKQKSMPKQEIIDEWVKKDYTMYCENDKIKKNYLRNKKLIDLTMTPTDLRSQIINSYHDYNTTADKQTILRYFMANRMRNLQEKIQEF